MPTEVGGQAAVALELAARRADADLLALYADRDRIGRDLHDLATQRLFAAGMTLRSVLKIAEKQPVRDGDFAVGPGEHDGTALVWRVPLER